VTDENTISETNAAGLAIASLLFGAGIALQLAGRYVYYTIRANQILLENPQWVYEIRDLSYACFVVSLLVMVALVLREKRKEA